MDDVDGRAMRAEALAGGEAARLAFSRLWQAYYRRLCVFAASYRGLPASEREDAVSEALIAAFRGIERYDPGRPLAPWVYRIARNRFASAARRAARLSCVSVGPGGVGEAFVDPPAACDQAAQAVAGDLVQRCREAMESLPEIDRRIAFLCFWEGLDSRETGRVLGMPAGTVRWKLVGIRARVRTAVGEDTP